MPTCLPLKLSVYGHLLGEYGTICNTYVQCQTFYGKQDTYSVRFDVHVATHVPRYCLLKWQIATQAIALAEITHTMPSETKAIVGCASTWSVSYSLSLLAILPPPTTHPAKEEVIHPVLLQEGHSYTPSREWIHLLPPSTSLHWGSEWSHSFPPSTSLHWGSPCEFIHVYPELWNQPFCLLLCQFLYTTHCWLSQSFGWNTFICAGRATHAHWADSVYMYNTTWLKVWPVNPSNRMFTIILPYCLFTYVHQ